MPIRNDGSPMTKSRPSTPSRLRAGSLFHNDQLPLAITTAVYNSSLYAARGQNTSVTSFAADNVFSDGTTYQMATVTGDIANGFVATLDVGIAVS